jgi:hypothetical protein
MVLLAENGNTPGANLSPQIFSRLTPFVTEKNWRLDSELGLGARSWDRLAWQTF